MEIRLEDFGAKGDLVERAEEGSLDIDQDPHRLQLRTMTPDVSLIGKACCIADSSGLHRSSIRNVYGGGVVLEDASPHSFDGARVQVGTDNTQAFRDASSQIVDHAIIILSGHYLTAAGLSFPAMHEKYLGFMGNGSILRMPGVRTALLNVGNLGLLEVPRNVTWDGNNRMEPDTSTVRVGVINLNNVKIVRMVPSILGATSYGLAFFQQGTSGYHTKDVLVERGRIADCWEGGVLIFNAVPAGHAARYHFLDNTIDLPKIHPNRELRLQGVNGIVWEIERLPSVEQDIELMEIRRNRIRIDGTRNGFGIAHSNQSALLNVKRTIVKDNEIIAINKIAAGIRIEDPLERDSGVDGSVEVSGNVVEGVRSGALIRVGMGPKNRARYTLIADGNRLLAGLGNQNNPLMDITGDWERIQLKGNQGFRRPDAFGTQYTNVARVRGTVPSKISAGGNTADSGLIGDLVSIDGSQKPPNTPGFQVGEIVVLKELRFRVLEVTGETLVLLRSFDQNAGLLIAFP